MNKQQWKDRHGLIAIFRHNMVHLYNPKTPFHGHWSLNNNGGWMEIDDLEKWIPCVWSARTATDLAATHKLCYCCMLNNSTCDFCGQQRSAVQVLQSRGLQAPKAILTMEEISQLAAKL